MSIISASNYDPANVSISGGVIYGLSGLATDPLLVLADLAGTGAVAHRAFINNALAPVWGAIAVGGGAVKVPVYFDGVDWRVG